MCHEKAQYIRGHFPFSQTAYHYFGETYNFVTVLRDPIKRWISTYFYNRYKPDLHRKIDISIEEYLNSDLGRASGSVYVKFLGGADETNNYRDVVSIKRAKENLHKFKLVGCLEHLENFKHQFFTHFGRNLNIRALNKNPKSKQEQQAILSDKIKNEIAEICQPDLEIYQYVLQKIIHSQKT